MSGREDTRGEMRADDFIPNFTGVHVETCCVKCKRPISIYCESQEDISYSKSLCENCQDED
jgi:hypothetical protein